MTDASAEGWRPRLVATDLDGTLLDDDGNVSARTREVLLAVDALEVPVVFTTGRPLRWMEHLWADVGGHGLAIVSNGGIVYDVPDREIRTSHPIPVDVMVEVAEELRRGIPGTSFAVESTRGFSREDGFFPRAASRMGPDVPVGPLEDIVGTDVVKVLARHEDIAAEPFWQRVEELVGDRVTTTWSSVGTLVEMSAVGVTKATTLSTLVAELGIAPGDVAAFGDMPNDLPLMAWAGRAYAMSNGHPSVISSAHRVAPRNTEDGVASVLADLFGLDA